MQIQKKPDGAALIRQLYALLMYDIEQDLLIENLSSLEIKYRGETSIERANRYQRYHGAIKTVAERMALAMERWENDLHAFLKEINNTVERMISELEMQPFSSLDHAA